MTTPKELLDFWNSQAVEYVRLSQKKPYEMSSDNLNLASFTQLRPGYQAVEPDAIQWVSEHSNQLKAARYAMHKVRVKEYAEAVRRREIAPEEGCRRYALAMENFEDVLQGSKSGAFNEAIDREMAEFDVGLTMVGVLPEDDGTP